ncbi:hypothetical protein V5799_031581 [Amblyomma americanum]|uniref:Secreted protein n=1 Tax=Amblyomma americanum TaxID=6943 RepID=A0AAQ4DTM0_AMBAM
MNTAKLGFFLVLCLLTKGWCSLWCRPHAPGCHLFKQPGVCQRIEDCPFGCVCWGGLGEDGLTDGECWCNSTLPEP